MKQTPQFKKAIQGFKKVVKFSALLDKSSTYIKVSGSIFNGVVDGDLNEIDIERIRKAINQVKYRTNILEEVLNQELKIETRIINLLAKIEMDIPVNFQEIVSFIVDDLQSKKDLERCTDKEISNSIKKYLEL